MFRNTMSKTYSSASASGAEAGFACPSCADNSLSVPGISLLVSVFLVFIGLCAGAILAGCGLIYIIIVPVLMLIINAETISLTVSGAQG